MRSTYGRYRYRYGMRSEDDGNLRSRSKLEQSDISGARSSTVYATEIVCEKFVARSAK